MQEYAVDIKHLSKVYKLYNKPSDRVLEAFGIGGKKRSKTFEALNDVSFNVKIGETVGIIGTNGAGKSTLLKIITGVLQPSMGEVKIKGKVSALLELGAGFNDEYSGIDNIYLNGRMMGYTKKEMDQKLAGIIEFADIGDFIKQPVKTYSSGMFARLAFAVAINVEPDILIIDEALSVGDIFFQNKCFKKFDELKIKYKEETTHGRINDAVIWLSISFELLLTFLYEYMFICDDEIEELRLSNEQVIKNILKNQEALYRNQEVELMFIDALEEMINLGKLCLLPVNKQNDDNQIISNYSGKFIGYYDKEFLYLYDSAMYAEVETFLKGKGQSISVSVNTLLKMLRDKNYIKTEEGQLKPKKLVYDSITKNKERIRLVHLYKKNLNLVNYKE